MVKKCCFQNKSQGAALSEYCVIVLFCGILSISSLKFFGIQVSSSFISIGTELACEDQDEVATIGNFTIPMESSSEGEMQFNTNQQAAVSAILVDGGGSMETEDGVAAIGSPVLQGENSPEGEIQSNPNNGAVEPS